MTVLRKSVHNYENNIFPLLRGGPVINPSKLTSKSAVELAKVGANLMVQDWNF